MTTVQNHDLALEEMRSLFTHQYQTVDGLDQKSNFILGATVITAALVATLQIQPGWVATIALLAFFILECGAALSALAALWPRHFPLPVHENWENLSDTFLTKEPGDSKLKLLSGYSDVIKVNTQPIIQKGRWLQLATFMFGLSIVPLLVLVCLKIFS